jgi:hypothetical protein
MNKLEDATKTTLSIHNSIDTRGIPKEIRIKHNAVGQCLRSLIEILENERNRPTDTQSATQC